MALPSVVPVMALFAIVALAGCGSSGPPPTRPPGGWIAFVNPNLGGSEGIYLMSPDGGGLRRISSAVGPGLSWSPDGGRIVFTSNPGISVMNADGSKVMQLVARGESPAWSPDGKRIAFSVRPNENLTAESLDAAKVDLIKQVHIELMNADGSAASGLTDGAVSDEWPTWSPDGARVAFTRNSLQGTDVGNCAGICIVNADGSGALLHWADGVNPAWAPDGMSIAYVGYGSSSSGIYVVGAPDASPTNLSQSLSGFFSYPAWSPDGKRIAFAFGPTGSSIDIYVVNSDGSGLFRLTHGVTSVWGIAWR